MNDNRKAPKRKSRAKEKGASRAHVLDAFVPSAEPQMHLMSEDEKHQLIRAHAEARADRPKRPGLGYYVAVGMSCVVVGAGWLMTLDANYGLNRDKKPDAAVEAVKDGIQKFKQEAEVVVPAVTQDVERVTGGMRDAAAEQAAEARAASSTQETNNE